MACADFTGSVGILLSGGLDSAIAVGHALASEQHVIPIYVRTGCFWQDCELRAIEKFLAAIATGRLSSLVILDMPVLDLYDGHWSITGTSVPDQFTSDEAVFLPGRNPLILLKPALWCQMHGVRRLAIGTLKANPFRDATADFFSSFEAMVYQATGDGVEIERPFAALSKAEVMELGSDLPLELTFSCLDPIAGIHCGACNKCAERRAAFRQAALEDFTRYMGSSPIR